MTILTKTIRTPVKAQEQPAQTEGEENNSIIFEGYAAVFDNIDSGGDKIIKGAFADTLSARYPHNGAGIPVYWNHETSDPFKNLGMTISAVEDDHGLKVEGTIDTSTDVGAQVAKLLKEHRVAQMSFAFDINEGGWIDGTKNDDDTYNAGYYELRKLDLFEVSICPIGMNQETEISAKKAMLGLDADQEPARPESTISQVEAAKRRLRLLTIN
ncbi:HK97 family phage prohead protease [Alloscardovia omnicolens]|uniref:HK97 family phage prohead protease n=1 Tax=Alloscardovia omnicolens TaxID=419015 RepID=UPI00254FA421|nr:HK97 family phage prohead protease [Alloscardovia omnicolens]MDK6445731.1 HK97 family phage prohead protease [Alloscardovia omnicolens]